jgi:sugar phosphate permease
MTPTTATTTSMDPRVRAWRYRVFIATWLCYAGYYFCRKPFYIAKAKLGEAHGFDATTLGLIGMLYLVAYAAAQFANGYLGHRFGARTMLLAGMGVSIVANVGFGLAETSTAFFVLMTVNGAAQASGWSANVGTMAAWFHRHERGRVMGLWTTNFQAGGIIANALASFALDRSGVSGTFFASAAALAAVWLVVLTNQRNSPASLGLPPVEDPLEHADDATKDGKDGKDAKEAEGLGWTRAVVTNLVLVGIVYFFLKLIRYALFSWSAFFLAKNFGLKGDDAGYLSTVFEVAGIPGVIVTGWLSDKLFGARRAGVSFMMTTFLLASCAVLYTIGSQSVTIYAVTIACIGFTLYGPDALLTGAGAMDIGSSRGATLAAGLISGVGSIGPIVQEPLIGKLYDAYHGALEPVFILLMVSAGIAWLFLGVCVVRNRLGYSDL